MVLPIGSYFSWARGGGGGGTDSRTSPTASPEDTTSSRRATRTSLWQSPALADNNSNNNNNKKNNRVGRYGPPSAGSLWTGTASSSGEKPILSPLQGLDVMQEYFWIEDNLRRTGRQLDSCSQRLDHMRHSAMHIRQELEGLQIFLASMGKRAMPRTAVEERDSMEERLLAEQEQKQEQAVETPTGRRPFLRKLEEVESPAPAPAPAPAPPVEYSMAELLSQVEQTLVQSPQTQQSPPQTLLLPESPVLPPTLSLSYTTAPIEPLATQTETKTKTEAQTPMENPPASKNPLSEPTIWEEEEAEEEEKTLPRPQESGKPHSSTTAAEVATHQTRSDMSEHETVSHGKARPQTPQSHYAAALQSLIPGGPMKDDDEVEHQHQLHQQQQEEEEQQTPRSLRHVQKPGMSLGAAAGGTPPGAASSTTASSTAAAAGRIPPKNKNAMAPKRASLKPVLRLNKVSQMTQFWSKMDSA